jgi:hypothetical protein
MKQFIRFFLLVIALLTVTLSYFFIDTGYEKETNIFYIDISYPFLYLLLMFSFIVSYILGIDLLKSIEKDEQTINHFKDKK